MPSPPRHGFPADKAASWLAAVALAGFPGVGILAKHGMSTIALTLVVLLGLLALIRGERPWRALWPLGVAPAALLALYAGHAMFADSCADCDAKLLATVPAVLLLLVLGGGALAHGLDRRLVRRGAIIGLTLGLAVAAVELLGDAPLYRVLAGRGRDVPIDPARYNRGLIALVLFGLATVAGLWTDGRRLVAGCLALAVVAVVFLGVSQAALLALGVAGLAFALAAWRERLARAALLAVMTAGLLAAPWIAPPAYDRAERWRPILGAANEHRFELWDHAAALARARPWLGWGIEAFEHRPIAPERLARAVRMTKPEPHPHNAALQFWVEGGLAGVLIAIGFLTMVAGAIGRLSPARRPWALALLVAAAAPVLVSLGLWQVTYLAMVAVAAFVLSLETGY